MQQTANPSIPLPPLIAQLNERLKGVSDQTLTLILLAIAAGLVAVALYAQPVMKAAAIAWTLAP
jgi:hypothetical protein